MTSGQQEPGGSVNDIVWDDVADVVVVGSGAAGLAAAVAATMAGASVVVLERAGTLGGTTAKSSGSFWVPNNPLMQEQRLSDPRDAALRYMARVSYPSMYDEASPTCGVPQAEFRLLEACYDRGGEAVRRLVDAGALYLDRDRGHPYPDYHADLPQDAAPVGRALAPAMPPGEALSREQIVNANLAGGSILIETLRRRAEAAGARIRRGHRVVHVLRDEGAVVGVEAHARPGRGTVLAAARRGVVFATGGFLHDAQLTRDFLCGPVLGGCACPGSEGDFVRIGIEAGAQLGNMSQAWWTQSVLEIVLRTRESAEDISFPFGDSMIQVNKYGHRVMDEKQTYNDRGPVHFAWDAGRREFPNLVLFQIYDDVVARKQSPGTFRGFVPLPGDEADYVLTGGTLDELAARIDARLAQLGPHTAGLRLAPGFATTVRATIERFSAFAKEGVDADFGRGPQANPAGLAGLAGRTAPRAAQPVPCAVRRTGPLPLHHARRGSARHQGRPAGEPRCPGALGGRRSHPRPVRRGKLHRFADGSRLLGRRRHDRAGVDVRVHRRNQRGGRAEQAPGLRTGDAQARCSRSIAVVRSASSSGMKWPPGTGRAVRLANCSACARVTGRSGTSPSSGRLSAGTPSNAAGSSARL
jgi:3-oxosteroid 1-dehydrogenase